jgi:novel protein kinase C epsilon type
MNVHKRCQKNVANNCGINTRDMAQILQEIGLTTDKLTKGRKKVCFVHFIREKRENS